MNVAFLIIGVIIICQLIRIISIQDVIAKNQVVQGDIMKELKTKNK